MEAGPLLLRKKRRVDFCKEEIIMILRAYRAHPTRWADVVGVAERLWSGNSNLKREVDLVRALERQHVDQPALVDEPNLGNEEPNVNQPLDIDGGQAAINPEPVENQPELAKVRPADRRDAIAADLSDPEDEPPRQRRRVSDLIRENHELYNNFMVNTLPMILRHYGLD